MNNNSESAMDISTDAPVEIAEKPRVFHTVDLTASTARHAVEGVATQESAHRGTFRAMRVKEEGASEGDEEYQETDEANDSGAETEKVETDEDENGMDGIEAGNIVQGKRPRAPVVDNDDTEEGASTVRPRFGPARPPAEETKEETAEDQYYRVPVPEGSQRVTAFGWVEAKDLKHEVFAAGRDLENLTGLGNELQIVKDYLSGLMDKDLKAFPECAKPFMMPMNPSPNVPATKIKAAKAKRLEMCKVINAILSQMERLPVLIIELGIDLNLARRYSEALKGRLNSERQAEYFALMAQKARHAAKIGHLTSDRAVR